MQRITREPLPVRRFTQGPLPLRAERPVQSTIPWKREPLPILPIRDLVPLPLEPVMATVSTEPESQPALASGRSPSSMVVAKQPGEAT